MPHQKLLDSFKGYQIAYELYTHLPLFTVEDSDKFQVSIKGVHTKNLFLKDKKKKFFLVSTLSAKRVDLKSLSKNFGNGHFSFGNSEELFAFLGVIPGSVTPYGLINDQDHQVNFLLDKDLICYDLVNFHPLRNDMTVSVSASQFLTYFEKIGRNPQIVEIPAVA